MTFPTKARIVEVGPRDGLQNEKKSLSIEDRIDFINELSLTGLETIEAGSFVSPEWVPQMANTSEVYSAIKKNPSIRYPVLVPNIKGMEDAVKSGVKEIAVFTAASDTFCKKNINCTIEESFERFKPVFALAAQENMAVRGYISCSLGCPYEGSVSPEVVKDVALKLMEMGVYEISIGDTIGVGTPNKVKDLLEILLPSIPTSKLAVHFHNTYGQAVSNIYAALETGISVIDSSVAGLGGCPYAKGASGNVATEDVLYLLNGLGIQHGIDLEKLVKIGFEICRKLGKSNQSKVAEALWGSVCERIAADIL